MAVLLCLSALAAYVVLAASYSGSWLRGVRDGALLWGGTVVLLTEVLSAFVVLRADALAAGWALVLAASLFVLLRRRTGHDGRWLPALPGTRLGALERGWGAAVAALVTVLGAIAVAAAPRSFDALAYHLPRVVVWLQNGTVAHFPTHNLRQLFQPPFAEYAILHLQALSGGDRFTNGVQWMALLGVGAVAALVARQLGASARVQLLAAVFAVTLPSAVLQAATPMNDLVPALWVLALVSVFLDVREAGPAGVTPARIGLLGLALGLALLTKGTSYAFAFPVCVWVMAWAVRRLDVRRLAALALVPVAAVALNAPHLARNVALFGAVAPASQQEDLLNDAMTPGLFASNLVRNLALHAATPARLWRPAVVEPVTRVHEALGIDVDDPRTTFLEIPFADGWPSFHEVTAANPLHVVLVAVAAGALLSHGRLRRQRLLLAYAVSVTAAFGLFLAAFKWQPYHTRLHLVGLALWAPFVAVVLARLLPWRVVQAVGSVLLVAVLPWLMLGSLTPVRGGETVFTMPRGQQYFTAAGVERRQEPYEDVARMVRESGCDDVGLATSEQRDDQQVEYPLWVLLDAPASGIRIQHVGVHNDSAALARTGPHADFEPCLVVALGQEAAAAWAPNAILAGPEVVLARPGAAEAADRSRS